MADKILVAIFMGSASDEELVAPAAQVLAELEIPYKITITSAHRTPARTEKLVDELENAGCQVFICAAGMAAHLAGAVAARTIRPVIGIPLTASALGGLDALLATVQMPPGYPVATVSLDKPGARNAAWLAAQIIALGCPKTAANLLKARKNNSMAVEKAASELEARFKQPTT